MSSGASRLVLMSSTFQVGAGGQDESSFTKPEACATYLTEIILLDGVALRIGRKLEWDCPKTHATNAPEAAQFFKRLRHKSWEYEAWWGRAVRSVVGSIWS